MKTSQIVAKAVLRLFLLLVLIACFVFLHNDNAKLQQFNFVIVRKWTLIFPFILIAGFITLLINCVVNKYKKNGYELAAGSKYRSADSLPCRYRTPCLPGN